MELLRKILKDKFAKSAFMVLCFLYLVILFADFIAPYSNYYANREMAYAPPSRVYTIDENGHFSRPYTYNYIRKFEPALMQTIFEEDRSRKYYIKLFVGGENYKFLLEVNKKYHLFGTIIPLEHPRFIMQYNSKNKNTFLKKYLNALNYKKLDRR